MDDEIRNDEEKEAVGDENKGSAISADLIRGHINTIILRTLYERDKYGYEIIEEIEAKSHGQYSLKQPTLYSALKRLESQGYINAYWKTEEVSGGGRRKYYTLTDSGREITEKNQSEWEYSRTVIDSLISDKNFDFTQPPPAPVDFKILKTSTSRVPTVKNDDEPDGKDAAREVKYDEAPESPAPAVAAVEVITPVEPAPVPQAVPETVATAQPQPQELPAQPIASEPVAKIETAPQPLPAQPVTRSADDERRIHENYLKLISEPAAPTDETPTNPYSERIDTDKLIYNRKPDTERDYKNLVDNLFLRTIQPRQHEVKTEPLPRQREAQQTTVVYYDDASEKANSDGLKVNSQDFVISSYKSKYNRGMALFKSSLIIAAITLLEFALSLAFMEALNVPVGYPVVILTLGLAQLAVFGGLTKTEFGKSTRKPVSHSYLTTSIVLAVISLLIIFVTSLILNVNFTQISDVMAKIIIPALVALNIPIFATIFYVFSK